METFKLIRNIVIVIIAIFIIGLLISALNEFLRGQETFTNSVTTILTPLILLGVIVFIIIFAKSWFDL